MKNIFDFKDKFRQNDYKKILDLNTPTLNDFIAEFIELLKPREILVLDDTE